MIRRTIPPVRRALVGGSLSLILAAPAFASSVTAPAACDAPSATSLAGRLWARARATLDSANRADASVRVRLYQHVVATGSKRVTDERADETTRSANRLFSSLDPDSIAKTGYVVQDRDEVSYYAPDLAVLLSDAFARSHCFGDRKGGKSEPGLVGLTFRPANTVPGISDIEGTMWLDSLSMDLRRVDFRYTGVPTSFNSAGVGGRLVFGRTPNGIPLLTGWEVRMPEGVVQSRQKMQHSQSRAERFVTVDRVRVAGGEIVTAPR